MGKPIKLLLIGLLLITLAACTTIAELTTPTEDNSNAGSITTTIADFKGRSDLVIKAEAESDTDDTITVLATGTVDTEGNIEIELPQEIDASFLEPLVTDDGCEFSPATNVNVFSLLELVVYSSDEDVGTVVQTASDSSIIRLFVTEDANIVCTNAQANANFKKGWNMVSIDTDTFQNPKIVTSSTVPWVFLGDLP